MKNLKLQHLRFFLAVYGRGSVTAAAEQVNATQSGVSTQIRDLEDILGLKLFERTSSGVIPTKAGDRLHQRASRILQEVGELELEAKAQSGQMTGRVRVGIMPTFSRAVLAPVLAEFVRENPMVEVKVTEGYSALLTGMVVHGQLDLAVVPGGDLPKGVRSRHLDTDMEILVQRGSDAGAAPTSLAASHPFNIVLPSPENARRRKIDEYLVNFCSSAHTIMELDSMMATLDMVDRGDWAAILPGCLCLPDLDRQSMTLLPIRDPSLTVDYLLIEPEAHAIDPAVRRFEQDLTEAIRKACETCRHHFGA